MHELAVCQALFDEIGTQAAARDCVRVARVTLEVGPLSGIVPELLHQAYEFAKVGTVADDAMLVIEASQVRVRCGSCARDSVARPSRLVCGHCGDWRTRLLAGDELVLRTIEFVREDRVH